MSCFWQCSALIIQISLLDGGWPDAKWLPFPSSHWNLGNPNCCIQFPSKQIWEGSLRIRIGLPSTDLLSNLQCSPFKAQTPSRPCAFSLLVLPVLPPPQDYPCFLLTHIQANMPFMGPEGEMEQLELCCRMPEPFPSFIARPVPEVPGFNEAAMSSTAGAVQCHAMGFLSCKTD